MKNYFFFVLPVLLFLCACQKDKVKDAYKENADWMSTLLKAHPDRAIALTDISVPASHDAAIYLLQDCVGGNECNTQTQYLNMKDQLEAGVRMFDIRPILHHSAYYTQHATDCDGYGCKGDVMANILGQTKTFLDGHAELVFLQLSHFCGFSASDEAFFTFVSNILGDRIYKETTVSALPFIQRPLTDFLEPGETKGKAILLFEGISNSAVNRQKGKFSNSILPTSGGWTNNNNLPDLKRNQLNNYTAYTNDSSRLFQFSWQFTQDADMAIACVITPDSSISIREGAYIVNEHLPIMIDSLIGINAIRKGKIPNIIYVDFADDFITEICKKITNLNME